MANDIPIDIVISQKGGAATISKIDGELDKLESKAKKAGKAVGDVAGGISTKNLPALNAVIAKTGQLNAAAVEAQSGIKGVAAVLKTLDAKKTKEVADVLKKYGPASRQAKAALAGVTKEAKALSKASKGTSAAFSEIGLSLSRYFGPAAIAAGIGAGVVSLIKTGDAYALLDDRIKRITKTTGDYIEVRAGLFEQSFETGQAVETQLKLFEAINRSRSELGASTNDILTVTGAIAQLGVVSGATQEETKNALRQLSQGLSADKLRAEEFNSIIENTPEIAFRIAAGLDKTIGQLQVAVREGEVLSSEVFESLLRQSEDIADEFGDQPIRLSRAFAQLGQLVAEVLTDTDAALAQTFGSDGTFSGYLAESTSDFTTFLRTIQAGFRQADQVAQSLEGQASALREARLQIKDSSLSFGLGGTKDADSQRAAIDAQLLSIENLIRARDQQLAVDAEIQRVRTEEINDAQQIIDDEKELAKLTEDKLERDSKVLALKLRFADTEDKLLITRERNRAAILTATSEDADPADRTALLLENEEQYQQARADLIAKKDEERLDRNQEFLDALAQQFIEHQAYLLEVEELNDEIRRFNELEALEGGSPVDDAIELATARRLQRREDAEEAHRSKLFAIDNKYNKIALRGQAITAKFEERIQKDKTGAILGLAQDLGAQLAGKSKAAFVIVKAAGIAEAIVNTQVGVSKALSKNNFALAAVTAAQGAAAIATIASTSFGGGGGGGVSFGGGGGNDFDVSERNLIPAAPLVTADDQEEPTARTAPSVTITGNVYTMDAEEFAQQVGPALNSQLRNEIVEGDFELIPATSSNGRNLRP